LKALIFDSWFDEYHGIVCLIHIVNGTIRVNDVICMFHNDQKQYNVLGLGVLIPEKVSTRALYAGQVGYVTCGMKSTKEARIGDTVYHKDKIVEPLPGFKPIKPLVFAGIYPSDSSSFDKLQDSIEKLLLSDSSVKIEKESSIALGIGFRCGFLGMLHMEVFSERLEQEYGAEIIITTPTVIFKAKMKDGSELTIDGPNQFPEETSLVEEYYEPVVDATVIFPSELLQSFIALCSDRRGSQKSLTFLNERVILVYRLPLSEIISDFHDKVKSLSQGYATFDYEESGYQKVELVKLNIMINREPVDAMSMVVVKEKAYEFGKEYVLRLRSVMSRQLFDINIQASIGGSAKNGPGKIIASERLAPYRKDVTAKCYGGDQSRKRKLLEKQKEGKKKMKKIGEIEVSHEAFLTVFKK